MGVKGLWKLLDGTGHPVDLDSLEGKVLAVDISVWLNMAIKGMRDYHGHASQTAHLVSLFSRICKLLYHGIKPVFVFDGQAPAIKQKALRERRERKTLNVRESKRANEKILQNFLKKQLLDEVSGKASKIGGGVENNSTANSESKSGSYRKNRQEEDIYNLPPLSTNVNNSDDNDLEEELSMRAELQREFYDSVSQHEFANVLNMNIDSKDFNSLPSDVQYELLQDLHEIRKRQRTRIETMPEESDTFSNYQIKGLLAKRKITKKMETVESKMSQESVNASSHLFGMENEFLESHSIMARQLVSDSKSHFIWMRKLQKSKDEDKSQNMNNGSQSSSNMPNISKVQRPSGSPTKESASNQDESSISATQIITDNNLNFIERQSSIYSYQPSTKNQNFEKMPLSDATVSFNQVAMSADTTDSLHKNVEQRSPPSKTSPTRIEAMVDSEENVVLPNSGSDTEYTNSSNLTRDMEHDSSVNIENHTSTQTSKPVLSEPIDKVLNASPPRNRLTHPILTQVVSPDNPQHLVQINVDRSSVIKEYSSDEDFIDVPEQSRKEQTVQISLKDQDSISKVDSKGESDLKYDNPWEGLDVENIDSFSQELDQQSKELRQLMQAKERAAMEVSQSAQAECQDLLKLFGIPFIVSPQEAEAQCATLEQIGLTGGTITDDSDIWLFGGKYVIKDMFGNKKDPVAYQASDIETQLGLNRDRFICIAMCSGSDYTPGIYGIGPVAAMEILKEFSGTGIDGLRKLKEWWDGVVKTTRHSIPTETKIKSQLRRVNLKKEFPSDAVYNAYMRPVVNTDDKKFEWGFPDLDELRAFATETMGWTRQRVDEILLPVIRRQGQRRMAQSKITTYLQPTLHNVGKKRSKRVQRAAAVLTGKQDCAKPSQKRPRKGVALKKAGSKIIRKPPEVKLSESSSEDD